MTSFIDGQRLSIDSAYNNTHKRTHSYNPEDPTDFEEYAELDFVDSINFDAAQQYKPLLEQQDDLADESGLGGVESKLYRLPSEGGSIFTSFVSYSQKKKINKKILLLMLFVYNQLA